MTNAMPPVPPWSAAFRDAVAAALAAWLPGRRWFGQGGRRIGRVDVIRTVGFVDHSRYGGPVGVLVIAAVRIASDLARDPTGPPQDVVYYQIPLGLRRHEPPPESDPGPDGRSHEQSDAGPAGPDVIARIDGVSVYDATADAELMSTLLALIAHGGTVDGLRFTDERPGSLAFAWRAGLRVRRNSTEQSNTSVVYGDRFILKLYRRLAIGINPELEVHRRLHAGHLDEAYLAALHGAIELDLDAGPVTLAILHSFVAVAVDGFDLVTAAARSAIAGDPGGIDIEPALRELGATVAIVHARLADAFGSAELTPASMAALRTGLRQRLTAAARAAPILGEHQEALGELVDQASARPHERTQRIHGDLHLGQALRTPAGWLLIDFEGEPAAPIEQRTSRRSPLQDVAGVLRSLDYAAGHVLLSELSRPATPPHSSPTALTPRQRADREHVAGQWVARAREAFWQGYTEVAGSGSIESSGLLLALEADKAVYEVVYEAHNRPDWISIPLRAVRTLTDRRMRTDVR